MLPHMAALHARLLHHILWRHLRRQQARGTAWRAAALAAARPSRMRIIWQLFARVKRITATLYCSSRGSALITGALAQRSRRHARPLGTVCYHLAWRIMARIAQQWLETRHRLVILQRNVISLCGRRRGSMAYLRPASARHRVNSPGVAMPGKIIAPSLRRQLPAYHMARIVTTLSRRSSLAPQYSWRRLCRWHGAAMRKQANFLHKQALAANNRRGGDLRCGMARINRIKRQRIAA